MISRKALYRKFGEFNRRINRGKIHGELKKGSFDSINDEMAEEFLQFMVKVMKIKISTDPDYRRNIEAFQGTYLFRSTDREATVLVQFENGQIRDTENVTEEDTAKADIIVSFKNGKAFMNFLLVPFRKKKGPERPQTFDIMESIRKNEVNVTGNLNYFYRFGYMANHCFLDLQKVRLIKWLMNDLLFLILKGIRWTMVRVSAALFF